jgi:hypothetical protein
VCSKTISASPFFSLGRSSSSQNRLTPPIYLFIAVHPAREVLAPTASSDTPESLGPKTTAPDILIVFMIFLR